MAVNVTLYKNLPYDPVADLIPLALVVQSPFVLVVNPQLPVHSVKELVAHAKEESPSCRSHRSGRGCRITCSPSCSRA